MRRIFHASSLNAFYIARTGRPGPVLIDIPRDVSQQQVAVYEPWKHVDIRSYKPTVYGHAGMIKRAAKAIAEAERMVIIAGGGGQYLWRYKGSHGAR